MAAIEAASKRVGFGEYFRGPQVSLYVGPDRVEYVLPKTRLSEQDVPFFKAAFMGGFSEAAAHSMELPDEEVSVFDLFVEWLIRGTVPRIPVHENWTKIRQTQERPSFDNVEKSGLVEESRPWHKLAAMAYRLCCQDLEFRTFEALRIYHSETSIACHPLLLEYDYIHMASSHLLEEFVMWSLQYSEDLSSEDYTRCLDLLSTMAPEILVKTLGGKQRQARAINIDYHTNW